MVSLLLSPIQYQRISVSERSTRVHLTLGSGDRGFRKRGKKGSDKAQRGSLTFGEFMAH